MTSDLLEPTMKDWDFTYYYNEYSLRENNVDSKKLSHYFVMENVVTQTMDIYERLLGLTFSKIPDHKAWHEDVTYYEVRDTESMNVLGHFYLDLNPRKNKYNHAAVF
jgi:Zn-dependent oligopeptidase